jgi:hypothetical protein
MEEKAIFNLFFTDKRIRFYPTGNAMKNQKPLRQETQTFLKCLFACGNNYCRAAPLVVNDGSDHRCSIYLARQK